MKIKGVSVDPSLLNQTVTDHARKLGLLKENEALKFDYIEVTSPINLGLVFKKD